MTSTATTTTLRSPLTCRHNHHLRSSPPTAPPLLLPFHPVLPTVEPQPQNSSSTEKPAQQQQLWTKPQQSRCDRNVTEFAEEEELREPQLLPEPETEEEGHDCISSIFRTSAFDDSDNEDLWTLKRAHPVTEPSIQEEEVVVEEETYESPSKRQCTTTHLDWDQALPTDAPLVLTVRSGATRSESHEFRLESL